MQEITRDTRPVEIESLKPYSKFLLYQCFQDGKSVAEMTFREIHDIFPTWDMDSMILGMEYLSKAAEKKNILYDVYSETECMRDPEKRDVKVFFLPAAEQPSDKPFIICASGGAYMCVCSVAESFPTAVRFNQLGYHVFVLNYRVKNGNHSLFPKPVDDMAAAVKYITENKDIFGLTNTDYIVNGFSAGANATVIYGTEKMGYAKYGLPKPKALFPVYPVISTSAEYIQDSDARAWLQGIMFGENFSEDFAETFNVPENMTSGYPPCYIVHAKDDMTVHPDNSKKLHQMLTERKIPVRLELAEFGDHGWGNGNGSGAAGWPDRAIHYFSHVIMNP